MIRSAHSVCLRTGLRIAKRAVPETIPGLGFTDDQPETDFSKRGPRSGVFTRTHGNVSEEECNPKMILKG